MHAGCGGAVTINASPRRRSSCGVRVRQGHCQKCIKPVLQCPFCSLFFSSAGSNSLASPIQDSHTSGGGGEGGNGDAPPLDARRTFVHHECGGLILDVQVPRHGAFA